ncbi:MAG: NAD(P)-binding domain-containing protein [Chloroflexota bacterium]
MSTPLEKRDTVIIGGGQAGLAMSYLLTKQGRDHVVLEKSEQIGASWRGRWDSFTLVTPNWQLQLPGFAYDGDDPDGFLARDEVVDYLERYAVSFDPPISFGVEVRSVTREGEGYVLQTTDGEYEADNVVVAVGAFQFPNIPACHERVPQEIAQLHSSEYRNPDALPDGPVLVVGSGQSGCQIAQELNESGRQVYLCTSSVGRIPRRYRGRDSMQWLLEIGMADRPVHKLESPEERFEPNPQISGKDGGQDINLHEFARDGVNLLGHLEDVQGTRAVLAPDLHQNLAWADQFAAEVCNGIDKYVQKTGMDVPEETVEELQHGYEQEVITELDLREAGIGTVLWATGFGRDYSWVKLPIFDAWGYPVQRQGVTVYPGLYFVGLHWLHTLKSGLFVGVGDDARNVARHMAQRAVE